MPKAIYLQIIDELKQLVKNPEYSEGIKPIPKEIDLAKQFSVSRETIRKSILQLVNDGVLYRKKRSGTFVNPEQIKTTTSLSSWSTYHNERNKMNKPVKTFSKKITIEKVRNSFAPLFKVKNNDFCVLLERTMGSNSVEVYFQSFFNPKVDIFTSPEFMKFNWDSLYDFIESKGVNLIKSEEIIKASRINEKIMNKLKITDSRTPILKRERFIYDDQNNLIEINIGYYNGDKTQYELTVKK